MIFTERKHFFNIDVLCCKQFDYKNGGNEMTKLNRRKFLTYVGTGVAALTVASSGLSPLTGQAFAKPTTSTTSGKKGDGLKFKAIEPSDKDELLLPKGYRYDVVAAYGDKINKKGDTFGFNNDLTLYFPIDQSSDHGLLWVNHEYSSDLFVTGEKSGNTYSNEQIEKMLYVQGGSIIEVKKEKDTWKMITDSTYARRVTGLTPITLTGPAAGSPAVGNTKEVQGTFANCSGGKTLWNTVLSCEENYEYTSDAASLNETHYGWVVEVDPFDEKFTVRKHTALGRFHHENAAMGLTKDNRVVVYMGDDVKDACVYKFISKGKYNKKDGNKNAALLEEGTLYAANLAKGTWIPLTIEEWTKKVEEVKAEGEWGEEHQALADKIQSLADILVHTHDVAVFLGATPTDRPEDVEIHPADQSIYIAHTNNSDHGNIHGHITRIIETENDLGSLTFDFEIFAAGGRQSGFSAPDNLTFDKDSNLWTVTDISSSKLNKDVYKSFKNNGVFVIPTDGKDKGVAFQFASAPVEAELTGPFFTPNEKTLFLSVQHPGEETEDIKKPTSKWPHRKDDTMPRPSVVAITGF